MAEDPLDRVEQALGGELGDPLAAIERGLLAQLGGGGAQPSRKARRASGGSGPGEGKHPLGATKPLRSEKAAARRKRKRSR